MEKGEGFSVFLMIALLAFAVVLVEERVMRTAVAVLPALWLAQRALRTSRPTTPGGAAPDGDRRGDEEVRAHIERLLKHFREFYSTCHLMGTGELGPDVAVERVQRLERTLNELLADVTEVTRTQAKRSR